MANKWVNIMRFKYRVNVRFLRRGILLFSFVLRLSMPLGMTSASAGSVDIQMSGTITDTSCDVTSTSATQSIPLGAIQAGTFTGVGATSPAKPLTISLAGCSDSITGAAVTFTGTADDNDASLIALTNTGTQASGVAVQLLDVTNAAIPINSTTTAYFVSPGSNTLSFHLRYKSTLTTVTPGDANAVLYFDMNYQ